MSGTFLFRPELDVSHPHRCSPPETGESTDRPESRLLVGTVWQCEDTPWGKRCGRRWAVTMTEQMELVWRRRRLPWRPRCVEDPKHPFVPPLPLEGGPTDYG